MGEGTGYSLMHPGMTRFHHLGLVVPFLAAISPMVFGRLFKDVDMGHYVVKALLFGIIAAFVSYLLMNTALFREDKAALNKAVLLGLLVSELTIFSAPEKIPSIVLILFFMFMYFVGIAEIH